MKYALTLCAIYCTLYFIIEAFAFFNLVEMLLRIAGSTLLTFVIVLAFDGFTSSKG